ncbi:MAG: hypothetical protein JWN00_4150 [Actinomycetia bacterium]|nr:hypothetical protein [Actinomycetes bacterium]
MIGLQETPAGGGRADGATIAVLFVLAQLIIPARLVVRGLPLSLTLANIVSLLACLCWVCASFTTTLGIAKGRTPARTGLFIYFVALLATYGVATAGYLPADELKLADHSLVLIIASVGLALLVCDGVRGAERLDYLLKAVVICGAVIGVIGALQFIVNVDLTPYLKLPGLRVSTVGGEADARNLLRRVASTTDHPIEFGVLCSMLLPLAVHFGFRARERRDPALRWWACAVIIGMGMLFSVSRSAVVGLAGGAFVLLLGWPTRRRLQALVGSVVALLLTEVLFRGLLSTFVGLFANMSTDTSVQYRTHRYQIAGAEIAEHLWFGRGIGTWYAPKYVPFDNQWIMSMVESGVLGTAAYAGIFLLGIYSALRARYLSTDPGVRDLGLTLAACVLVPMLTAATFDLRSFGTVNGLSFLFIGASGALLRTVREAPAGPPPRRTILTGAGLGPLTRGLAQSGLRSEGHNG